MAVDAFTLSGQIITNAAQSGKELTAVQKQLLELTQQFTKEEEVAKKAGKGVELSLKQQATAAESLQRQRSAALLKLARDEERSHQSSLKNIQSMSFTGAAGQVAGFAAEVAALAAPAAITAGAVIALAKGIYDVTSSAAAGSGKIKDLSDQTGFAAESVSGLGNSLELVGGNIDTASNSLVIFEGHMEEAHEEGSKMAALFKRLNIDIDDNEKALRQAIEAIANETEAYKQNALAKELFGRAGKQIAGIVRDSGGDLDEIIAKFRAYNTLIGTDAANAGDALADKQVLLRQQFQAASRELGEEFYPLVTEGTQRLTQFLRENGETIRWWGETSAAAIQDLANWGPIISQVIASALMPLGGQLLLLINLYRELSGLMSSTPSPGAALGGMRLPGGLPEGLGADQWSGLPGTPNARGAKAKKGPADFGRELLEQLTKQSDLLGKTTREGQISVELLDKKYIGLSDTIKELILAKAREADATQKQIDINNKLQDVTKSVQGYYQGLLFDIEDLASGGASAVTEFERFLQATNRSLKDTGKALDDFTVSYGRFLALTKDMAAQESKPREFFDNSAESLRNMGITTEWATLKMGALDAAIAASLGDAPELIKQADDELRRLADDIVGIFDNALYEDTIGGFFRSILLGFIDLVRQMGIEMLRSEVFNWLKSLSSSGGGSWWGKLIGALAGSIGGGAVGGAYGSADELLASSMGFGGIRDAGGPMSANKAYWSGVPEWIVPSQNSQAVLPQQMGNNYYINVAAPSSASYIQPRSRREMGEAVLAALQRAA